MAKARELTKGFCRVCPQCNGVACAGEVPGMGGLGSGASFKNNISALADIKLNLRVLHQAARPDLRCNFMGIDLAMPVMAAPIGGIAFNMAKDFVEADYTDAIAQGCLQAGVMGCLGDSARDDVVEASFATLPKVDKRALMFFKPWEQKNVFAKLDRLNSSLPVGMDVDAAGLITLALMDKSVSPKSPADIKAIVEYAKRPFIVKGVMTVDEALIAAKAGAKAVVVSNHGGRVLDHTPGSAAVLPAIARAAKGHMKVIVDGGVRSGADVLKMLALGADLVFIGRPLAIAAVGGGAEGVARYLNKIKSELTSAMIMTGCASVADITGRVIYK